MMSAVDFLVPDMPRSPDKTRKDPSRVDLRIDPDMRAEAEELAQSLGQDLSSYIRLALAERMQRDRAAAQSCRRRSKK